MSVNVSIEGLDKIERKLNALPGKVARKVIRKAVRAGQKILKEEVQLRVPVDQGKLKESIKIRLRAPDRFGITARVIADAKIPRLGGKADGNRSSLNSYAAFVEFGTKKKSARPYARPALEAKGSEVIKETEKVFLEEFEKIF